MKKNHFWEQHVQKSENCIAFMLHEVNFFLKRKFASHFMLFFKNTIISSSSLIKISPGSCWTSSLCEVPLIGGSRSILGGAPVPSRLIRYNGAFS